MLYHFHSTCFYYIIILTSSLFFVIAEPECRIDGECDPDARCLNNTCVCNEGFSGNGTNCVAITGTDSCTSTIPVM